MYTKIRYEISQYKDGEIVKNQNPFRDFNKFGHLSCVIQLLPFVEVKIRVYVPEKKKIYNCNKGQKNLKLTSRKATNVFYSTIKSIMALISMSQRSHKLRCQQM